MELPVYRIILLGSALAFISFNAWSPAQGVVAYELTGNNRAVGFVVFGQGVAMTLLNPLSGAIADRMSKRFLILACQIVAFVTMSSTGVLVMTRRDQHPVAGARLLHRRHDVCLQRPGPERAARRHRSRRSASATRWR